MKKFLPFLSLVLLAALPQSAEAAPRWWFQPNLSTAKSCTLVHSREDMLAALSQVDWAMKGGVPNVTWNTHAAIIATDEAPVKSSLSFIDLDYPTGRVIMEYGWKPDPRPMDLSLSGATLVVEVARSRLLLATVSCQRLLYGAPQDALTGIKAIDLTSTGQVMILNSIKTVESTGKVTPSWLSLDKWSIDETKNAGTLDDLENMPDFSKLLPPGSSGIATGNESITTLKPDKDLLAPAVTLPEE